MIKTSSRAASRRHRRDLSREAADQARLCRNDFLYFAEHYVWYTDKNNQHVNFIPNDEQLVLLHAIETHGQVLNLKARKLGMSTLLCFYALWLAMFHRTKCALLAHDDASVKNLVRTKFRYAIDHLPSFLRAGDYEIRENNMETGLVFAGGGSLRVSHNEGAAFRGGDIGFLHISEFAFLADPDKTFAAALNACLPGTPKVIETTAKGLGKMHELWYGDGNAWKQLFFPWMTGPDYKKFGPGSLDGDLATIKNPENLEKTKAYIKDYRLSTEQARWFIHKLAENSFDWTNFHREFPATPKLAFSTSKGRVFSISFKVGPPRQGKMVFGAPGFGEPTSMGVDTAYGYEDGDYHAYAVMSGTREKPNLLCTGYSKTPLHVLSEEVRNTAIENNAMIIGDPGGNGAAVLDDLRAGGYPNIYRRRVVDRVGSQGVEKLGYAFSEQGRAILVKHLMRLFGGDAPLMPMPPCPRLQHEINEFKYNEDHKDNRPEHGPGAHDDLLFAVAMAYHGLDPEEMKANHVMTVRVRPKTEAEELLYEMKNGKAYDPADAFDDDDDEIRARNVAIRKSRERIETEEVLLPMLLF